MPLALALALADLALDLIGGRIEATYYRGRWSRCGAGCRFRFHWLEGCLAGVCSGLVGRGDNAVGAEPLREYAHPRC